jgi:hypothetical protein
MAQLESLQDSFFERATAPHTFQLYVPSLRIGGDREDNDVRMLPCTSADWRLIKSISRSSLIYNVPRLFQLGVTNHFDGPDGSLLDSTIDEICDKLLLIEMCEGTELFRIRLNLSGKCIAEPSQYDSPPGTGAREFNRFDQSDLPILYASPSLTVCIHECRATLNDEVFVATLRASRNLRIADLSSGYDQNPETPFDDLEHFFNGLMLSSRQYDACRRIGKAIAQRLHADGIIYRSFFSNVTDGPALNYGIFGHPVAEKKLDVISINQVRLEKIQYKYRVGPIFDWENDWA